MEINTLFQMLLLLRCFEGYTSQMSAANADLDVCSLDGGNTSTCTQDTSESQRPASQPRQMRRRWGKPKTKTVCYGVLGCFSNEAPYNNANGMVPDPPAEMGVTHMVYSRNNKVTEVKVSYDDVDSVKNLANINPSLPLKIVIHGFKSEAKQGWTQDIKNAILEIEDVNVYLVDWSGGSGSWWDHKNMYNQAIANTRVVAAQVAKVVQQFHAEGLSLDDVHLIGHSLGAHTCGEVGKLFNGTVGRITGLDPASPGYEDLDFVKLDATDAQFVDAIHTDGRDNQKSTTNKLMCGGLGTMDVSGHVDVYVNGGEGQPGCKKLTAGMCDYLPYGAQTVEGTKSRMRSNDGIYCSHGRVHSMFAESIKPSSCTFKIYKCDSYELFQDGKCLKCPSSGCDVMGYHTKGTLRGTVYLDTRASEQLCGFHYLVDVTPKSEAEGEVLFTAIGTKGRFTHSFESTVEDRRDIALSKVDIGDLQTVEVKLVTNWYDWNPSDVILSRITVQTGETETLFSCLSEELSIKAGETLVLECVKK